MVERLSRGPASVSELARPFDVAGRIRTFQLAPGALDPAGEWISRQRLPAERRLDRLGAVLSRTTTKGGKA